MCDLERFASHAPSSQEATGAGAPSVWGSQPRKRKRGDVRGIQDGGDRCLQDKVVGKSRATALSSKAQIKCWYLREKIKVAHSLGVRSPCVGWGGVWEKN